MSNPFPKSGLRFSFLLAFGRRMFVLCLTSLIVAGCWVLRHSEPAPTVPEPPVVPPGLLFTFPTPQTNLDDTNNPAVFMPTESGRIESAWYGTTRTRKFGKSYLPAFHGGVDIAPVKWDSKGRADDPVFAVADGRIGYINRIAGNSSYGIYVAILHRDVVGEYYTLYSHLASAGAELKTGDPVSRGMEIGRLGHTSTLGIPVQRSHLHFEFGTLLNSQFSDWYRKKDLKPFHGNLHGYNLGKLNPMVLFPFMKSGQLFDLHSHIIDCPVAFRMIVRIAGKPDYYRRYPSLWVGGEPSGAMVMDVSHGGVPLQARAATVGELDSLQKQNSRILEVFPDVLDRNGVRLIVQQGGRWVFGEKAEHWLEILLYQHK